VTRTINSEANFRISGIRAPSGTKVCSVQTWEGNASTIDTYFYPSANIRKKIANPCPAAVYGYVDAVIQPRGAHRRTIAALEVLDDERTRIHTPKQSGNILYFSQILAVTLRRPELDDAVRT
jgi:hypothetical protein